MGCPDGYRGMPVGARGSGAAGCGNYANSRPNARAGFVWARGDENAAAANASGNGNNPGQWFNV